MKPLQICFFNRSYYPDQGATGQLLTELAETLVRDHGCCVAVVVGPALFKPETQKTGDRQDTSFSWLPFRREMHNGVEIFRTNGTTFRPRRFASRILNYLSYFSFAVLAGFRVPSPDVVVALTDPPIVGLAALLTTRRSGAKFVFLCQDIFPELTDLLEDFRSETINWMLDWISRCIVRKSDRVVALGETMRKRLIEGKGASPERVKVIHNWADCSAVVPGPKRNPFSIRHGLEDFFVVMHSGNIGLSQGLETVIEAAHLLRKIENIKFVLVGEGVKKETLQAKAKELNLGNVLFLPYQPKEHLTESFSTADVFIVSLKRGLAGFIVPSKLYGVLASGRPYIASTEEESEVAQISRNFHCGLITPPGDFRAMADGILSLYQDRKLSREMGKNARRAAMQFDRPLQVRAYYDLFREIVLELPARRSYLFKRIFDISLSGLGLLVFMPVWVLIVVFIKLEDGGPVFYWQERMGINGEIFRILKFRSMIPDAEKGTGPVQSDEGDARITKMGHVLRATAMDELPQLWSIFSGYMSFVGPRAIRPGEKEIHGDGRVVDASEIPGYKKRQSVLPGLTGLAQIYGKHDTPRKNKFRYDLLYIRNRSFCLDVYLIILSLWITFRGKWESRGKKV